MGEAEPEVRERVIREAEGYLGGMVARSVQRESTLLALYGRRLESLLAEALAAVAQALAGPEHQQAGEWLEWLEWALWEALEEALAEARSLALEGVVQEISALAPGFDPEALGVREEPEAFWLGPSDSLVLGLVDELRRAIVERYWLADVFQETLEEAGRSLLDHTLLGIPILLTFARRVHRILVSEWVRAANWVRWEAIWRASDAS